MNDNNAKAVALFLQVILSLGESYRKNAAEMLLPLMFSLAALLTVRGCVKMNTFLMCIF